MGESSGDLCRKIANLIPGLPLVILSASPDVAHKVLLLEMGADDYVTIPFSPRGTCRSSAYAHEEQVARQPAELARL
jgi:DNA-binding response OmpR family regulator